MANHTVTLVLLLCCTALTVQARLFQEDPTFSARSLQQVNQRCPAGCDTGACVLDSTSGGYKCTKCQGQLVVNQDNGKCECPAGRYAGDNTCVDCTKSYFCEGGVFDGAGLPAQTACPDTLTTIGKRSISKKACVNLPGHFYTVNNGEPSQDVCPINTYGPGLRKQRACVPCPPGYSTLDQTARSKASDCAVPKGYYLKGPGQVAPCPKGEYKDTTGAAASCTKCAAGVTTEAEASIAETACKVLLPTFYAATLSTDNIVKATKKCPQKYYCPGGNPTAAFQPSAPTTLAGTTIVQCADATWTDNIGASSADQCMTPPGYYTTTAPSGAGSTDECPSGKFRAEWKPAAQADSCDECGANIESSQTEEITAYDISTEAPSKVLVRAAASACYIKPGQGMYFSPATTKYTAVNCESNNYGVANTTYGLAAYPCRDCPGGMQTMASLAPSSTYKSDNGFTSPLACVTKAGFGYNGRVASQCPVGAYNAEGNYGTCTQCPAGYSTSSTAAQQVAQADCKVAAGYGFYNNAVIPCPVGSFNADLMSSPGACTSCSTVSPGLTTSQAGGRSSADCNVCSVGYGDDGTCSKQCGGAAAATYGPAGRNAAEDNACEACPTMSVGFSFDYLAVNQPFTPASVARTGAGSAADCLAEFAQIEDAAWFMGGSVALSNITASLSANTFGACVDACQASPTCQYVTYDYDTQECFVKTVGTATTSGDVLAFKAVVAGDTTAASVGTAKALASGSYTFWADAGAGVGASSSPGPTSSGSACLSACDSDGACAAVAMAGVKASLADGIDSCSLIKGVNTVAQFKRSVTKTVATKLQVSAALP